jgi:hypothetical protein
LVKLTRPFVAVQWTVVDFSAVAVGWTAVRQQPVLTTKFAFNNTKVNNQ